MSLFQRRPTAGESVQYYTFSQNKIVLIIGLGNPGSEYDGTRHNIGFACLDAFTKANGFDSWIHKRDLKCHMASATLGDTKTYAIKPTTYMNLSGEAVRAFMQFYKIPTAKVVVIHDELDIPFGQIRMRTGGSSAGHNGLKSIIQYIGEDFGRVRVGIGPKTPEQIDSADFVLGKFNKEQQSHINGLTRETSAILSEYAYGEGSLLTETRNFII